MKAINRSAILMLPVLLSGVAEARPFGIEARSLAMGNASVAVADIATAPFANPAMLAYQKYDSDFALLLPAVGVYIDDSDGVVDLIDQYQAAENAGNATGQLAAVQALDGKVISPQAAAAFSLGMSGEQYAFAVSARANVQFAGGVTDIATTQADLADNTKNRLKLNGLGTSEVGISIASNLNLLGYKLAVGITPKIIRAEYFLLDQWLGDVNTDVGSLLDKNTITDLGSFTTLDAGLVLEVSESIQLGVVAKNLLTKEIASVTPQGLVNVRFDTQVRAGMAYNGDYFRLAADVDLTENAPVLSLFPDVNTRMLSVGAEFNAFDFAQLRVGMQRNLATGLPDGVNQNLLTAGVGFWFGFHLDVTAVHASDVSGLFVQTGFRF